MGEIKLDGYICERCEHTWISRITMIEKPRVCPKCKSPYWDTPRRNNQQSTTQGTKEAEKEYGLFPT